MPGRRSPGIFPATAVLGGGTSAITIGVKPKERAPDLTLLREALGKLAAPPYAVRFRIRFKLWGGDRAP